MSNRIQLSESTWLDDGYAYTRSREVACQWFNKRYFEEQHADGSWGHAATYIADADAYGDSAWRIPITELPAIYGYVKNEPWVHIGYPSRVHPQRTYDLPALCKPLHLRAVIPCGGNADSLRKLWEVIQKVGDA